MPYTLFTLIFEEIICESLYEAKPNLLGIQSEMAEDESSYTPVYTIKLDNSATLIPNTVPGVSSVVYSGS